MAKLGGGEAKVQNWLKFGHGFAGIETRFDGSDDLSHIAHMAMQLK